MVCICGGKTEEAQSLRQSRVAMELKQKLVDLLNQAQNGLHHHRKLLKTLQQVAEKTNNTQLFFDTFYSIFCNVLLVFKREPAAERLVEFVTKFAVSCHPRRESDEEEDDSSSDSGTEEEHFTHLLVAKLISVHEAKEKAVRFRVCQFLAKLIAMIADEPTMHLRSSILDAIVDAMLVRLSDKVPIVRVHAVQALARVQEPSCGECPIISSLLWSLENDTSPDVRKVITINIAVNNETLPSLLGRTRDINAQVRRAAFLIISEKCSIFNLSIKQRLQLLQSGLKDRSPIVNEACIGGLLRSWCMEVEGDFLTLLCRLDVESSPDIAELALNGLFEQLPDEELLTTMEQELQSGGDEAAEESKVHVRFDNNIACCYKNITLFLSLSLHPWKGERERKRERERGGGERERLKGEREGCSKGERERR